MNEKFWQRLFSGVRRLRQRADWDRFAGTDWADWIMQTAVTDRFHAKQGRSTGRWVLENEAGRLASEAVRSLRDRCPKMTAPLRTPVDPSSRGFLIVWVLHANDAPPVTFLAGETAPATAEAINEGFLRGVQAVRTVAQNP